MDDVLSKEIADIFADVHLVEKAIAYIPGQHKFWVDAWYSRFHPQTTERVIGKNPREAVLRAYAGSKYWMRDRYDPPEVKEREDSQMYGLFRKIHGTKWPDKETFQ
jgi:hypothetical protein